MRFQWVKNIYRGSFWVGFSYVKRDGSPSVTDPMGILREREVQISFGFGQLLITVPYAK